MGDWRKQLLIFLFHPDSGLPPPLSESIENWVYRKRANPALPSEYWILVRHLETLVLYIPFLIKVKSQ